ncbi:hypothetical protein [Bartonella sp. CL34QHWL]
MGIAEGCEDVVGFWLWLSALTRNAHHAPTKVVSFIVINFQTI